MTAQPKISRQRPARERILDAAIICFSGRSYDETSLRDIADTAHADVAYVHRSYGSKAELFRQALLATFHGDLGPAEGRSLSLSQIADRVVQRKVSRLGAINPQDILFRSISCAEARPIISEFLLEHVIQPLAAECGHDNVDKAALIMAFVGGVSIMRDVVGAEPLASMDEAGLRRAVMSVFQHILHM